MRIASLGHAAFAATFIFLGILGFLKGSFSPIWDPVPKGLPARELLVYLCAFISLASGVGLLFQRTAALGARTLLAFLLAWLLLFRTPPMFRSLNVESWWAACETAVMLAAAWVLYTWFATDWDRRHVPFAPSDTGLRTAKALYGLAIIPFGLAHFLYFKNTVSAVPSWLPWHAFWAYFTGAALIIAGIAVLIGVYAGLAATLSALEIGMFTLLVWVPIMAKGSKDPYDWSETIVSAALTAGAWVVANSYRGIPKRAG